MARTDGVVVIAICENLRSNGDVKSTKIGILIACLYFKLADICHSAGKPLCARPPRNPPGGVDPPPASAWDSAVLPRLGPQYPHHLSRAPVPAASRRQPRRIESLRKRPQ